MKKIILVVIIALFLLPTVALAEGEDITSEDTSTPEESVIQPEGTLLPEGEAEPDATAIPEQTNGIVITDANGNQYVITAESLTGATTTLEPTGEVTEAEIDGTADIIAALQAQGVNISPEALKTALTEIGFDVVGLTATVQTAIARPMLTTPFEQYTVLEGLLLILCVLTLTRMVFKLFAM